MWGGAEDVNASELVDESPDGISSEDTINLVSEDDMLVMNEESSIREQIGSKILIIGCSPPLQSHEVKPSLEVPCATGPKEEVMKGAEDLASYSSDSVDNIGTYRNKQG